MHGSLDKQSQEDQDIYRSWSIRFIVLPVLIAIALIGMVMTHPSASRWISEAAQAEYVGTEFVGTDVVPDIAPPTKLAKPTTQIRTVHAY
jgi:hypothetical protein